MSGRRQRLHDRIILNDPAAQIDCPLFNDNEAPEKTLQRIRPGLLGKSSIHDAVALLPKFPLTQSMAEASLFLINTLPYNSVQTRERRSRYFRFQMFPGGRVNLELINFAHRFPNTQALRDVCFYQLSLAEPLIVEFADHLNTLIGISGVFDRSFILHYLRERFPDSAATVDCASAIMQAFEASGLFNKKGNKLSYAPRDISIPSLLFVIHSEFPQPGMYDIGKIENNPRIRALQWRSERLLSSLYELRNQGFINKVSEIDNVRQFTTKWTLPQIVERLSGDAKLS